MSDVAVIGAGVVGLSVAYELAGRGLTVRLFDQSQPGQEASWAGAGMLPPGNPSTELSPEARLRGASHSLWTDWAGGLLDETGIDTGYRRCGSWELRREGRADALDAEVATWRAEGVLVEPVEPGDLPDREAALAPDITAAYRLPEFGQVRNPRLLKALLAGCLARGVRIHGGTAVYDFLISGDRVRGVRTAQGDFDAEHVLVSAGAWSGRLLGRMPNPPAVRPLRGQVVLLQQLPLPLTRVINVGLRYIVPRGDGRILVGSTEEAVGFEKRNTAGGVAELLAFATQMVPQLERATIERTWSGLRPQSADGWPYLGRMPGFANLWIATGHFRSGLQLSPITAVSMADLIVGDDPLVDLLPFAPDRKVERAIWRPEACAVSD
jgi:glycine oxidase